MDINCFIEAFADLFEETEADAFSPETHFRDLAEWSSLIALSVMSMIDDEYDVQLNASELRQANTIQELFEIVSSKKS
ncbi:MAG: acyl carrier protein [Bacteroidales bacterium]|nr:acyl carrier protein [Bacteroidales bacterium]